MSNHNTGAAACRTGRAGGLRRVGRRAPRWARGIQARTLLLAAGLVVGALPAPPLHGADTTVTSSEWVTRSWLSEDGLPQDTVNALLQTRDGFLWVGTSAGLARFDGVRFRKFGLQDGLRSVLITALAEDREGGVWIGTSGGGVSRWEAGRLTSFGPETGWPAGVEVIALAADRDGSVWIGTDKGLVQWSGGTFRTLGEAQGVPPKQIRALLQDSQGTLWVSVIPGGLIRRTGGGFERLPATKPAPGDVYSLLETRDGAIWAGAAVLWKWSGGAWQRFDSANGLPRSNLQKLAQSPDGTLWIGTRGNGLYRLRGDRFEPAADSGPLAGGSVGALQPDREGSLWVGMVAGGVHRLAPRVLQYWEAGAGLAPTTVTSVVEDASGALWAGTTRGLLHFDRGRFLPPADPVLSGNRSTLYCTATTSDGAIWAAGEQCLFRLQAGQPARAYLDPPVRGEAIRALCADGEALWLGTYYSALLKGDAAGVRVVAPGGSFPGTITSLAREAPDTLWVGTSSGLHRWERGQVRTWTTQDGLLTGSVRALHRDADGTLWIGTLGGGLARMRDGRFFHFTTHQGLIDDVISQIVPDDFGALWLGCNRGIMRLERSELEALSTGRISELHPEVLDRNEGMLKEQCFGGTSPTALKARDGRLYFPTMTGLAEIDPRRLQDLMPHPPQASIEDVLVDQRRHAPGAALVIPPGQHRVDISFTAPVLHGGEWVRFHHRLEGLDPEWISAGVSRHVSYDSLVPGQYVFRVAAADGQGNWTEPGASLEFTVLPFFWQTLWFRAGGVLLLVGASSAGAWWRLRQKHLQQLAVIERERRQQAELAHAGRVALFGELSASLAHELNQPLTAILSNAQAALRFLNRDPGDVAEVREILRDIAESDRRAVEIITRMRAMMKKGEAQLETHDLNADVDLVLQLLRGELAARKVTADLRLAPGLPPVRGDHIQLQQVLLNLVMNGCDAMHANPPDERRLLIETARDGDDGVHVSVTDRGPGVAPANLERIFEPFFSTKDSGLGMGLAICRAIIRAHGGRLWVVNQPDRGATFHFTLKAGTEERT